jgi:hypothetical protein
LVREEEKQANLKVTPLILSSNTQNNE